MNNLLVSMLDLAGVPGVEKLRRQHGQSAVPDRTLMRLPASHRCIGVGAVRVATCVCVDAIKRRDHKAVTTLMAEKADVNAAQPDGATALAWAAYLDDRDAAEALLKAGAKVETADEYGETPLTLACATGDAALVDKFLKAGANPNAARWNGETALMIAANSGSVDAVKLLLDAGAKINAAEQGKGQTALMWAAAEGHSDVVKLLIARGADVKAASKSGFTAAGLRRRQGRPEIRRRAPRGRRRSRTRRLPAASRR